MSDYGDTIRQHRRLAILRHLEGVPEYTSNASILQSVLGAVGLPSTSDQVIGELAWLKEQGLVEFAGSPEFVVVIGTRRGAEIATGVGTHPGIQRPRPRI